MKRSSIVMLPSVIRGFIRSGRARSSVSPRNVRRPLDETHAHRGGQKNTLLTRRGLGVGLLGLALISCAPASDEVTSEPSSSADESPVGDTIQPGLETSLAPIYLKLNLGGQGVAPAVPGWTNVWGLPYVDANLTTDVDFGDVGAGIGLRCINDGVDGSRDP